MGAEVANEIGDEAVEALLPLLERAAVHALAAEGSSDLDVSVTVVGDPRLHELNREWLGHDWPTDVVTFPLRDDDDPDPLLGEVVVSADRARAEAAERGLPFAEELCRYVIHGCLHLLGYDDADDAARDAMHARQEALLAEVLAAPPAD